MAQTNRSLDIGTGLFVLLGFLALAFLTTQLPGSGLQLHRSGASFPVTAKFDNIGGLKVGAPVTMAGVTVGRVDSITFDTSEYKALVSMSINQQFDHIPDDSDASIQTSGLLGANYVGLGAGGSEMFLRKGSEIQFTQSAIVLENLINKFFANTASNKSSDSSSSTPSTDASKPAAGAAKSSK